MKRSMFVLMIAVAAGVGAVLGSMMTIRYFDNFNQPYNSIDKRQQLLLANYKLDSSSSYNVPKELDFRSAANLVRQGVVHIRTSYGSGDFSMNALQFSLESPAHSSGSGVVVTDDGYIVTNNHVIEDATNIEVIMSNNERYYAKVIGTDVSTDLALLKIKARNLPFVKYGNSDRVLPGEWVLAIGNPFDLNSTVTAGIVSAKARNIGILRDKTQLNIESFIQTDAAVNPGNSGGALVNLNGELIGINTAIATATGHYEGYSFAIPVSLVRKVMDDLLEFGKVQRGLLGIQIKDVDAKVVDDLALSVSQGVLVERVNKGSAAEESGITIKDVIIGIEDLPVHSVSELQEIVARHRPGKEIKVTLLRNGETREIVARLRNYEGTDTIERKEISYELGGATFAEVPYKELTKLEIEGGVRIADLGEGKWKKAGVRDGFIISYIDKIPVDNVEDLNRILEFKKGGILIEGFYEDGEKATYGVNW
ncbi:MAG TPA: trypsin-like peptidase domain-containing protein [Cyclobacteriaceae bacterium]|nr:trypsin-like peptidase domain-containing protein [Cyclobacteriaceae bacterium]